MLVIMFSITIVRVRMCVCDVCVCVLGTKKATRVKSEIPWPIKVDVWPMLTKRAHIAGTKKCHSRELTHIMF
jgi:hypothetical protein